MTGTPLTGWDPKDPNDTLEYELDWGTNFLAAGETISSSVWSVTAGAGLTVASDRVSSQTAYVTLASGVADTLVDLRMERLSPVTIEGRRAPGTTHVLHETLSARHAVTLHHFTDALLAVDQRWREGGMQRGVEFATSDLFAQVHEALELDDHAMVETLTRVHMAALRAQAIAVRRRSTVPARMTPGQEHLPCPRLGGPF